MAPRSFLAQAVFLATRPEDLPIMITEYYRLNPRVMRDIIGRKLQKRVKDATVSSISEHTGVPVSICKRQV